MDSLLRAQGRIGSRTLLITSAALPLTGWAIHAAALHKQLAAPRKDPLTGLRRRDTYTTRAHRLLARHGDDTTVVMIDANRFKEINDGLGHAAGDTVLALLAARLTAWAGPRVAVRRLGGEKFAVILELPAERREQRLEQLVRMLHTPVTLDDGRTVDVAAWVGAATPDVICARDLTRLQRAADTALYDGKHSGKAMLATAAHAATPTVNGRRAGRPGTALWGRAA